ncbi:hypothetical protein TWF225_002052 [Orbilia oligospora]|nr:hypothetical protein TWF225_002052 [Orbilia oligospora]KAF3233316.1 hypothetical protein TWF128_003200 [Orbilia oligospora]KAF3269136.1 hypothetical protein TWF217_009236 [Orbilia oligospora]
MPYLGEPDHRWSSTSHPRLSTLSDIGPATSFRKQALVWPFGCFSSMAAAAPLRNEYHLGNVETSEFSLLGLKQPKPKMHTCPQDQATAAVALAGLSKNN